MRIVLYFLVFMLVTACQSDEADEPEVRTNSATSIGLNRAIFQGVVVEVGPLKPIQYGFLWSNEAGIDVLSAKNKVIIGETSEANLDFSIEINELTENTTYYVKSFAMDIARTAVYYGNEISFTTAQPSQYLSTLPAEAITSTSASLKGEVADLNELENITYGFAWSSSPFTSILEAQVRVVGTTNTPLSYEATVTNFMASTTYYYRAFISNASGTVIVYGEQETLTTTN